MKNVDRIINKEHHIVSVVIGLSCGLFLLFTGGIRDAAPIFIASAILYFALRNRFNDGIEYGDGKIGLTTEGKTIWFEEATIQKVLFDTSKKILVWELRDGKKIQTPVNPMLGVNKRLVKYLVEKELMPK